MPMIQHSKLEFSTLQDGFGLVVIKPKGDMLISPMLTAALLGDSISYVGDASANFANTYISIDGGDPQIVSGYQESAFQRVLWSSANLIEGAHQIIITRSNESSRWWMTLDYLQVLGPDDWRPSSMGPGAASVPDGALLIDDDHNSINYEGTWKPTNSTSQSFFFGGLEHTTTIPGNSLTFFFNGTAVWYFSDKRMQNGWAMISIDGSKGEQVSTFLPDSDNRWFSQVLCWEKTGLRDGEHQVTITHADVQGMYVSLDFFKYMPSSGASASTSSKLTSGGIIGLAVGGSALLIIALAGLIYWIRRFRRLRATENDNNARAEDSADGATEKDTTLASQPVTPGPKAPSTSEAWVPNSSTDMMPAGPGGVAHTNQGWPHQIPYAGLPEV
ncbi:hypothetical protein BDV93DRAFT_607212 [Ceratobasidium sp. AG-I]|nr:hypothetical protein BDV93DRAFT_607212 [Ceratobasidium sp. AG-I]